MAILRFIIGAAVLTLGRQLFWIFVGAAGFALGITFATRFVQGVPDWAVILIALAAGVLGALLAVFVQELAIAVAGFVSGAYVLFTLLETFNLDGIPLVWILYIVAGVIGAILVVALFDWALILLSSLAGASLIIQSLRLGPGANAVLFIVLVVVGIVIQASLMRRYRREAGARQA